MSHILSINRTLEILIGTTLSMPKSPFATDVLSAPQFLHTSPPLHSQDPPRSSTTSSLKQTNMNRAKTLGSWFCRSQSSSSDQTRTKIVHEKMCFDDLIQLFSQKIKDHKKSQFEYFLAGASNGFARTSSSYLVPLPHSFHQKKLFHFPRITTGRLLYKPPFPPSELGSQSRGTKKSGLGSRPRNGKPFEALEGCGFKTEVWWK